MMKSMGNNIYSINLLNRYFGIWWDARTAEQSKAKALPYKMGLIAFFIASIFYTNVFAGDEGTTAASYLKIPMSARATALAGAFSSLDAGVHSLFWNPATLALLVKKEISLTYNKWFLDTSYSFMGIALPISSGYAMAFGANLFNGGQIQSTNSNGQLSGWTDNASATVFSVCNEFTLFKNFYTGFGVKYIAEDIATYERSTGFTADAGFLVTPIPGRFNLGFSVQNIFGDLNSGGSGGDYSFPRMLRAGITIIPLKDVANISVDFMNADTGNRISAGMEFIIIDILALRGGYRLQLAGDKALVNSINTFTAGVGVKIKGFLLDFAMLPHSEKELGMTYQVSMSMRFGARRLKPGEKKAVEPASVPPEKTLPVPVTPPPAISKKEISSEKRMNIAIMNFAPQEPISPGEAAFVTEFFRGEIVNSKAFRVVEKANMDQILAEQGFQQTGCTTQECVIQMGKVMNVQKMITGQFGKLMNKYFITINMVDIETAEVIYTGKESVTDSDQIEAAVNRMALKLINTIYK